MKLKNQIELLNDTLKLHDEKVDEHFPKDESQVPAYAKAQYMDLFGMLQEIAKAYEFTAKFHKASKKALVILVTNLNEHSEMVNEITEETSGLLSKSERIEAREAINEDLNDLLEEGKLSEEEYNTMHKELDELDELP